MQTVFKHLTALILVTITLILIIVSVVHADNTFTETSSITSITDTHNSTPVDNKTLSTTDYSIIIALVGLGIFTVTTGYLHKHSRLNS